MATLKLVLRKQKINKSGTGPIYIRITKKRKVRFISLNIRLDPKHWDEEKQRVRRTQTNSARLNTLLKLKIAEAQAAFVDLELMTENPKAKDIKDKLFSKDSPDFLEYGFEYIAKYERRGKIRTFKRFRSALNKLKEYLGKFHKGKEFLMEDMDIAFLKKYERYIRTDLKNCTNTVNTDFKSFRRIINEAIELDLFPYTKSPFIRYKLGWEKTKKVFLTENELQAFEEFKTEPGSKRALHQDIFVFACNVGGLRISDLCCLRWINFDGTHIMCSTIKTGSVVSIKVPKKGLAILEKYKKETSQPGDFIFPIMKEGFDYNDPLIRQNMINSRNVYANKDLKFIAESIPLGKHISFHSSRHTWATRALRKGMRIEYVSRLMGHASIRTTQVYAKIVNEDLDKAMDVFDE